MNVLRKLESAASLPWRQRLRVFEAALAILAAKLVVEHIPFRIYARWLARGTVQRRPAVAASDDVRRAIECAARNLPCDAKCLPQAMAAAAMLRRRRHRAVLRLGVRDRGGDLQAHAWVTIGEEVVVGGRGRSGFGQVASFGLDR